MPYDPKQPTYDPDHHEKTMIGVEAEKKKSLLDALREAKKKLLERQATPQINRNEYDQMKDLEK